MTSTRSDLERGLELVHRDVSAFSRAVLPERVLRQYQLPAARAIAESVNEGLGRELAVVFWTCPGLVDT